MAWNLSLTTILIGKEDGMVSLLGESKWFLGKMNGPLEEQVGSVTVHNKACLGVVLTSSLLSHDESVFPGW